MNSEEISNTSETVISKLFFIHGLLIIASGLLFYFLIRTNSLPVIGSLGYSIIEIDPDFGFIHSFPSFVHSIGFSFLSLAFVNKSFRNIVLIALIWTVINIYYEYNCLSITNLISRNTTLGFNCAYNINDIIAIIVGTLGYIIISSYILKRSSHQYENYHEK